MSNEELPEAVFNELAKIMDEQSVVDDEINAYAQKKLSPVYEKRREKVKQVPRFWPTVLINSGLLEDYIAPEDSNVLEHLTDLFITWDEEQPKSFNIHLEFEENDHLETLKIDKKFKFVPGKDDETPAKYVSEPVKLEWKKDKDLTKNTTEGDEDESFFKWFDFTGEGPGEYQGGELLALTLVDDVYPHALKFFVDAAAMSDDDIEFEWDLEEEDGEGEEDGQDEEHEDAPPKKKAKNE